MDLLLGLLLFLLGFALHRAIWNFWSIVRRDKE